jgi:multidrug transporter EmrE-like cation transporter
MNLTAFALVAAAACLHALWNLAAKRASGNLGVLWLGLCLAGVALAPFALYDAWQSFDPAALPYLAATGLIHAGYFGLLAAGYRQGELSIVYPLARGTGVAGTARVAWAVLEESSWACRKCAARPRAAPACWRCCWAARSPPTGWWTSGASAWSARSCTSLVW